MMLESNLVTILVGVLSLLIGIGGTVIVARRFQKPLPRSLNFSVQAASLALNRHDAKRLVGLTLANSDETSITGNLMTIRVSITNSGRDHLPTSAWEDPMGVDHSGAVFLGIFDFTQDRWEAVPGPNNPLEVQKTSLNQGQTLQLLLLVAADDVWTLTFSPKISGVDTSPVTIDVDPWPSSAQEAKREFWRTLSNSLLRAGDIFPTIR